MLDHETLVDRIYEAAADADLWPQVLHEVADAANAAGGIILTRRSDAWLGWRHSPALEGVSNYLNSPAVARSEATTRLLAANRAGFVDACEVFSQEEWLADPLMTEWAIPAGLHHAVATAMPVPSGDLIVVQVNRRKGQPGFGREDLTLLDAFRPHLARAGLLAARWRLERLRAGAEALAIIGLPAVVLDADGRVLAANSLIGSMSAHLTWLPKDRVALADQSANGLLKRALADLRVPAATSVRSFATKNGAESPVVVHLIPITGQARDLFGGGFGILIITPLAAPCAPHTALIQGLFDLTAAEARVAGGVAEGLRLDQIADRHGVALGTVRSQVKSIFAKTGAARQSQLAALLAAQAKFPLKLP